MVTDTANGGDGGVARTPHESGHSFITASGLLRHSPASAQMAHCVELVSAHLTPSHTPHEPGHSLYMNPGCPRIDVKKSKHEGYVGLDVSKRRKDHKFKSGSAKRERTFL